ncbi:MAG: MtnX-like HAD-IB family phosphatase [bacterium]
MSASARQPQPIRVFTDFDGTISTLDVGATLFNQFAGEANRGSVILWMKQKIDSRECLLRECAYITARREQMEARAQQIEIQPGFREFVELTRRHELPLHVCSDGLDFYIEAFFRQHGFENLDIHCNQALWLDGHVYPVFPYYEQGCGFCGTCKGERVRSLSRPGELKVYIGDGFSDRCALQAADLIFARDDLAKLCEEKGVDYQSFADFYDVIEFFQTELLPQSGRQPSGQEES